MSRSVPLLFTIALLMPISAALAEPPDFNRDIRPILSSNCLKCHGPDDDTREADLRLDVRESATKKLESGAAAIVPGNVEQSELIRRILSTDPDVMMPPPAANKTLTAKQKDLLTEWIKADASYAPHWSLVPPKQAPRAPGARAEWSKNAIDDFILARLEKAGLAPSPEADRATLARRVSLDLIGLPPSPAELDAFLADESPDAYEKLVDRLLASPYYGERWARRWLDLARYADTNGYEKDRPRSIWPYRDWVIQSINADMPFDQFTVEQLAGDLLPNAGVEQRIATGFHRNTLLNEEGGIDPLEFRYYAMVDRVNTTGTVWLGMTVGCAQCHTHKFDPIPHRDYYRLMAYLNNADEPTLDIPNAAVAAKRQEIEQKISALLPQLPGKFPADAAKGETAAANFEKGFTTWLNANAPRAVHWTELKPSAARSNLPLLTPLDDNSIFVTGDQSKSDRYEIDYNQLPEKITAVRLEAIPDDRLPKHGPGRVFYEGPFGDFFLSEFTLTADGRAVPIQTAVHTYANGNTTAAATIDGFQQSWWSINGGQGKPHVAVYTLKEPLSAKSLQVAMLFERYHSCGLGRFRISVTGDPRQTDSPAYLADIERALIVPADKRTAEQTALLKRHYADFAPELAEARKEIDQLRASLPELTTSLVLQERPATNPRPTHMHKRGEFLQTGEKVEAELPSLFGTPSTPPRDRLAFARWLASADNPLVGRVTMNRHWAAFFGRGIVKTTEDFGYQGEPPTHPALLDWLAVELRNQNWSMKRMHRLIVTSATYRQSSAGTADSRSKDSDGSLLSRFPRVRLDAELVRDAALRAAGLLASRVGGPSVYPAQPPGVTSEGAYGSLTWKVSDGPDRHRRGLYTFTKRSAPFAMAATFDAPSGEFCVARREVSNTPLQALTLMNDEIFLETARAIARRAVREAAPTADARAAAIFRYCLVRPPSREEAAELTQFFTSVRERFQKTPASSNDAAGWEKLIVDSEGTIPAGVERAELAALTAVARAVLNLDEFVTKE
ncbi:MAG: PSD1 and planctomycete cytochrome C domain-containing protein [Planctomycetaceae bacterium]